MRAVWPAAAADVGADLGARLGRGRHHAGRRGRDRARVQGRRRRPDRLLVGPGQQAAEARLRPHVPDAVRRPHPQRGRHRRRSRSARSPRPTTSTASSPPAAPTCAPSPGRISPTRPGRCSKRRKIGYTDGRLAEAVPLGQGRSSSATSSASGRRRRRAPACRRSSRRTGRSASERDTAMKHNDPSHALLEDAARARPRGARRQRRPRGAEAVAAHAACTTQIEAEIRRRLRERFGISLARFDYMAQLYRYRGRPEDARPVALPDGDRRQRHRPHRRARARRHGGAREQPERPPRLDRAPDRQGPARSFETMAREHEGWILELFAGLDADDRAAAPRPARAPAGAAWCKQANPRLDEKKS